MKKGIIRKTAERLAASKLADTYRRVRSNKGALLYAMILDALFILTLFGANKVMTWLFPNTANSLMSPNETIALVVMVIFVYFAASVSIYSFFKFLVMRQVKRFFAKGRTDFSHLPKFIVANAMLILVFSAAFMLLSAIFIISIRVNLIVIVRNFFFILAGLMFYLTANTMHSLLFQRDSGIKRTMRDTLGNVFNTPKRYFGLLGFTVAAFLLIAGAYYLFDWAVLAMLGDAMTVPRVYVVYAGLNTAIIAALALGLLAFNRVYFYNITLSKE